MPAAEVFMRCTWRIESTMAGFAFIDITLTEIKDVCQIYGYDLTADLVDAIRYMTSIAGPIKNERLNS